VIARSPDEVTEMTRALVLRCCFAAALVLALLGTAMAWAQGIAAPERQAPGQDSGVGGPSIEGVVEGSLSDQPDLAARREHCSVDPDWLRALGLVRGQQVRIDRAGVGAALFTVSELREESPENVIRMGKLARARFGPATEFPARVFARAPHPTLGEAEARRLGEFIERSDDDGAATGLLVLAPHGGEIEPNTDLQAERLAADLAGAGKPRVTTWRCLGYDQPGGASAYLRWHITSTETDEVSFPLLARIAHRRFAYTVSFHGMTRDAILIGGRGPDALKRALRDEIARALGGSGIPVVIATEREANGGSSPRNIVNRYCAGTGVQIEQSPRARRDHWRAIADAVARVYAPRL
jgi:phage replication-related protein YjqB (UPF0714/DUF867 family)